VRAMAVVCEQHNSATLKIVGPVEDRFRRYLRRIAEESGVANAVHFAGAAFGEERDKLMTAADIFVLPSHDESFGLAPLEALMCGLPVVVSEKVDSVRALPRSAAARIVDRTPAELGAAILTTLRSDTAHEIARLQRHIAENLTWDASAAKMEHLYSELRATGSR
jgi:glycosyltransferase involved in cell wall biosynthesis